MRHTNQSLRTPHLLFIALRGLLWSRGHLPRKAWSGGAAVAVTKADTLRLDIMEVSEDRFPLFVRTLPLGRGRRVAAPRANNVVASTVAGCSAASRRTSETDLLEDCVRGSGGAWTSRSRSRSRSSSRSRSRSSLLLSVFAWGPLRSSALGLPDGRRATLWDGCRHCCPSQRRRSEQ